MRRNILILLMLALSLVACDAIDFRFRARRVEITPPAPSTLPANDARRITPSNLAQVTELARMGKGVVNQIAVAPNGKTIAAASSLGLYLLDGATLRETKFLTTTAQLDAIAFSPDGAWLVGVARPELVFIWRASDWTLTRTIKSDVKQNRQSFYALAFMPDSQTFALAGVDSHAENRVWLIRAKDGEFIQTIVAPAKNRGNVINSLMLSPDGSSFLAVTSSDPPALRQMSDGAIIRTLGEARQLGPYLAWSPNGEWIATSDNLGAIQLVRASDGVTARTLKPDAYTSFRFAFSHDSTLLAAGSNDHRVRVWRVADGALVQTFSHNAPVTTLEFAPDDAAIISAAQDGTVRAWRVADGQTLASNDEFTSGIQSIAFSPDGATIVAGTQGNLVWWWRASDGARLRVQQLAEPSGARGANVLATVFSPNGEFLATGSSDERLRVFRADNAQLVHTFVSPNNGDQSAPVNALAFSPDSRFIALGSANESVLMFRLADGAEMYRTRRNDAQAVTAIAFSPDGAWFAALWGPISVTQFSIFRTLDGSRIRDVPAGNVARHLAISPDGALIATSSSAGIGLWKSADGASVRSMRQQFGSSGTIAFSPDGSLLASEDTYGTLAFWRVTDGAKVREMRPSSSSWRNGFTFAFSPDGRLIATGGVDGVIRLWGIQP